MQVLESAEAVLRIIVRVVGIGLVVVGAWIGVSTVEEAWDLYRDPGRVERFALAIEQGSGIDTTLASASGAASGQQEGFRPSYFLSWIVAILLLLVVAKVAVWMIVAGGKLTIPEPRVWITGRAAAREKAASRDH